MKNLSSLLITVGGILLFLYLLPALLWIVIIVLIIVFVFVSIQKAKFRRYAEDMEKNAQSYEETYSTRENLNSDVIDVEFSESEDDIK